jgi:hypothetical protein
MGLSHVNGILLYRGNIEGTTRIPMPGWKGVRFIRNGQRHLEETQKEAWTTRDWNIAAVLEGTSGFVVSRERFLELRVQKRRWQGSSLSPDVV